MGDIMGGIFLSLFVVLLYLVGAPFVWLYVQFFL